MAIGVILALGLNLGLAVKSAAQTGRIAFQISTGSTGGTYFPIGELLTGILSHPPGIGRCLAANVCGPAGLIVSTRASEGSVANVLAVNSGSVSSGLAQADVVAMAVAGQGPFKKTGPARQLRVIANLYGEDVHLIAAKGAKIAKVADLRGKRVSLSTLGSGTIITARAILSAYGLSEAAIRPNYDAAETALDLLDQGKLDAIFLVEGAPVALVQRALAGGNAVLVPIDGAGQKRLLEREHFLAAHSIAAGTYKDVSAISTVSVDALWITDTDGPSDLIYGIDKALYHPVNRAAIEAERAGAHFFDINFAAANAAAPLHPGTVRYLTEMGVLKPERTSAQPVTKARKS